MKTWAAPRFGQERDGSASVEVYFQVLISRGSPQWVTTQDRASARPLAQVEKMVKWIIVRNELLAFSDEHFRVKTLFVNEYDGRYGSKNLSKCHAADVNTTDQAQQKIVNITERYDDLLDSFAGICIKYYRAADQMDMKINTVRCGVAWPR